jgi:TolA-binding protein
MTELRRLREETDSGLERALLEAGTAYRSSPSTRARTLAALGVAGSVALSTGAAGGAFSSLLAKMGWTKLAISAAFVAGALPVGYYAWHRYHVPPPTLPAEAIVPAAVEASLSAQPAEPTPVQAATAEPPAPDTSSVPRPAKTDAKPGVALAAELGALDAVRSALAQGDPGGALSLLDAYAKDYPRGRLELEAEVLRIDALARAGQTDLAKKRAETFLKRYPKSVLASRVRGYL